MNNISNEKRVDDDILHCKHEILRIKSSASQLGRISKISASSHTSMDSPSKKTSNAEMPSIDKKTDFRQTFDTHNSGLSDMSAFSDTASFSLPRYDEQQFSPTDEFLSENSGSGGILEAIEAQVANSQETEPEIPEFNLAEQIMAEQRKAAGNRRKAPGSTKEEPPKPILDTINPSTISIKAIEAPMSPQQKIIADIVAKDIEKYYIGRKVG